MNTYMHLKNENPSVVSIGEIPGLYRTLPAEIETNHGVLYRYEVTSTHAKYMSESEDFKLEVFY